MAARISINKDLKGDLGFIGVFDMGFLFIVEICHDAPNRDVASVLCTVWYFWEANCAALCSNCAA